jgi:hypothetical protein
MIKPVAAVALGAVLILGTATASFAQGNGNAIGGGAAGGPGAKAPEPTAGGSRGNDSPAMTHKYQKKKTNEMSR